MDKFFMVWVAGEKAPKRMHPTIEIAKAEAERLASVQSKCAYVLTPIHQTSGRRILTLKRNPKSCIVEPKE